MKTTVYSRETPRLGRNRRFVRWPARRRTKDETLRSFTDDVVRGRAPAQSMTPISSRPLRCLQPSPAH